MPTILTVTDLATTPTGVSATISGSNGAVNSIYAQQVTGQAGSFTWTLVVTQTGDGTLVIALAPGYWYLYCLSAPATLSGIAYTQVTTGLASVLDRCVTAIASTLSLLALPSANPGSVPSPTSNIVDALKEDEPKFLKPGIILTTDKAPATDEMALNGRDDIGHAVRCLVKDICLKYDSQRRSLYRGWWQSIFRAFHNQRLAGVPESVVNRVEMHEVTPISNTAPQLVMDLTIRAITREVRGLGA